MERKASPKLFLSEFNVDKLRLIGSLEAIGYIDSQIEDGLIESGKFLTEQSWKIEKMSHKILAMESEYASWLAAYGIGANHFTIDVSQSGFRNLATINTFVKGLGYQLNQTGGEIKGSPEIGLEQSSTMAEEIEIEFTDGKVLLPGCFYEFAHRHPVNGSLFQGFFTSSADKIFESTFKK